MALKSNLYVQFGGKDFDTQKIMDDAKELWKAQGKRVKDLNTDDLYLKPEENKCYYVFNGESSEDNYFEV